MLGGFHEVIYTEQTRDAYEKAKLEGRSTWRVSSTMFTHFRGEIDCSPLPALRHLYTAEDAQFYGGVSAFDILMTELNATNMTSSSNKKPASPEREVSD